MCTPPQRSALSLLVHTGNVHTSHRGQHCPYLCIQVTCLKYQVWSKSVLKWYLLLPTTKLGQGNIFRSVCQQFCLWGHAWLPGGHAWFYSGGMCGFIRGGVHGFIRGVCVVLFGGVHGFIQGGRAWFYLGGHAWFYSVEGMRGFIQGGVRGFIQWGGVRGFFSFSGYNEIRSMSGRYASYWNAFLCYIEIFRKVHTFPEQNG